MRAEEAYLCKKLSMSLCELLSVFALFVRRKTVSIASEGEERRAHRQRKVRSVDAVPKLERRGGERVGCEV